MINPITSFVYKSSHLALGSESDIVYLIDTSQSVNKEVMSAMTQFLKAEVNTHASNANIGIINYGKKAEIISDLTSDSQQLYDSISGIKKVGGDRRVDVALKKYQRSMLPGARADRTKQIILFITGGNSLAGKEDLETILAKLKTKGVKIIVIAIGNTIDKNEVTKIALGEPENVIYIDMVSQLAEVVPSLFLIIGKGAGELFN